MTSNRLQNQNRFIRCISEKPLGLRFFQIHAVTLQNIQIGEGLGPITPARIIFNHISGDPGYCGVRGIEEKSEGPDGAPGIGFSAH